MSVKYGEILVGIEERYYICRKGKNMDVTLDKTKNILLTLPKNEVGFLRSLAKKMGWTPRKQKESSIDKSLKEAHCNMIYSVKDMNNKDIVGQILNSDV